MLRNFDEISDSNHSRIQSINVSFSPLQMSGVSPVLLYDASLPRHQRHVRTLRICRLSLAHVVFLAKCSDMDVIIAKVAFFRDHSNVTTAGPDLRRLLTVPTPADDIVAWRQVLGNQDLVDDRRYLLCVRRKMARLVAPARLVAACRGWKLRIHARRPSADPFARWDGVPAPFASGGRCPLTNAKRIDFDLRPVLPAKPGLRACERERRLLEAFLREGLARRAQAVRISAAVVCSDAPRTLR